VPRTRNPFLFGSSRSHARRSSCGRPAAIESPRLAAVVRFEDVRLVVFYLMEVNCDIGRMASLGEAPLVAASPLRQVRDIRSSITPVLPPSRVTCARPSSVPTQIVFGSTGEIDIERIAPTVSAPLRSSQIGPPLLCCLVLSFRVRSGLMDFQLLPPSLE